MSLGREEKKHKKMEMLLRFSCLNHHYNEPLNISSIQNEKCEDSEPWRG